MPATRKLFPVPCIYHNLFVVKVLANRKAKYFVLDRRAAVTVAQVGRAMGKLGKDEKAIGCFITELCQQVGRITAILSRSEFHVPAHTAPGNQIEFFFS